MTTSSIDEFFAEADYDGEKLDAFKFQAVGDTAGGTICKQPKVVELESKFGKGLERRLLIVLEAGGVRKNLWVKGQMATAIKEAFTEAGANGLAEGGRLAVRFDSTKDTGKGNPMKVFRARYEPPAPAAAPGVDDFFNETTTAPAQQAAEQPAAAADGWF